MCLWDSTVEVFLGFFSSLYITFIYRIRLNAEAFTFYTCNNMSANCHCELYFQCVFPSAWLKLRINLFSHLNLYSCHFYSVQFWFTLPCFRLQIMPNSWKSGFWNFLSVRFPCIQFYQKSCHQFLLKPANLFLSNYTFTICSSRWHMPNIF